MQFCLHALIAENPTAKRLSSGVHLLLNDQVMKLLPEHYVELCPGTELHS